MNQQIYTFTPDQLNQYLDSLIEQKREGSDKEAFRTLVDYVLRKKHQQWTIGLQKLMYRYFDMALELNNHDDLTKMLKEYRSDTEAQYSDSLNHVLVYYRDKILDKTLVNINKNDIKQIRAMANIQDEEVFGDLLIDSFNIKGLTKVSQLRNNMKIVWNGYKSIIKTVKSNSKLQELYMHTLQKLFEFAEMYNRKHEFKEFCKNFGYGFHNVVGKKYALTEAQKAINTDYEKPEVNERNVQIRFKQFEVALKLGLWQSSFEIIEDINELLNLRKGAIKRPTLAKYHLNLSKLFKKSNYWNYYAFANYNYYNIYSKNPKIDPVELQKMTDQFLLSILAIPPFSIERNQTPQSQKKISSLLTLTNKIPTKQQLFGLVVEKGYLENASPHVKELWTFLFVEFNLLSVNHRLPLLKKLKETNPEFSDLIQGSIINQQILEVSKIYSKIRMTNLYSIIPFNKEQVLNRLLSTQQNGLLQFKYDESKGVIQFKQKLQERTAYSELNRLNKEIALITQKISTGDRAHILKKVQDVLTNSKELNEIRNNKIEEFTQKLKKPRKEAKEEEQKEIEREKRLKETEQTERKLKEELEKADQSLKQKELTQKKNLIKEIIKIKERRVIRIEGKTIESLGDLDMDDITVENLQDLKKETEKKNKQDTENKYKKAFIKSDYIERERREKIVPQIKEQWELNKDQVSKIIEKSKEDFKALITKKTYLLEVRDMITSEMNTGKQLVKAKYDKDLAEYQHRITREFKERIINRAKQMKVEAEELRIKQQEQAKIREEERQRRDKDEGQNPFIIKRSNLPSAYTTGYVATTTPGTGPMPASNQWRNTNTTPVQSTAPTITYSSGNTLLRRQEPTIKLPTTTPTTISTPTPATTAPLDPTNWRNQAPTTTTTPVQQPKPKPATNNTSWRRQN